MKKILYIVGGLIAVIIIIALVAGDPGTEGPELVDRTDREGTSTEESAEVAEEIFSVGDTVRLGDLEFSVNSARWDTGSQFMAPDPGEKWLVVDVTLNNLGDKSEAVSSLLMFGLVDKEGYSRDIELFADTKGSLDGELGTGRTMRGEIAFNVEEGQAEWEFIFAPNVFGFGQAIFAITEADVS